MKRTTFSMWYDLLHALRDNNTIDRKQFNQLFNQLKQRDLEE